MAIKMYNGRIGFSTVVHVILEDKDSRETLCGLKSADIHRSVNPVTCQKCMSDAQRMNKKGK